MISRGPEEAAVRDGAEEKRGDILFATVWWKYSSCRGRLHAELDQHQPSTGFAALGGLSRVFVQRRV